MSRRTTLDAWTEICHSLHPNRSEKSSVHPIHSCVISGVRHYVHAPSLSDSDPSYFQRLLNYAKQHHIVLKADRREIRQEPIQGRRKRLLPIMFLAFGMNTGAVFADTDESASPFEHIQPMSNVSLAMISPQVDVQTREDLDIPGKPQEKTALAPVDFDKETSLRLQAILSSHLVSQDDDPDTINGDITLIANYYAAHPEATKLLDSIADKEWKLSYAPHTFQTDIKGSRINIEKVHVYFDPRSAAKLKFYDRCSDKAPFCVASPADALLHELLHVQSVVTDTSEFISSGGLSSTLYPAEHEHDTILKENILYASMTRRDKHPRPIRSEHSGRHVLVSCVTCVD
ncbi:MAG: hypothetical protein K6L76_01330 [Agarilytica sp.]